MNAGLRDSFSQNLKKKKAKVRSEWKNYIKNKAQRHWSIDRAKEEKKGIRKSSPPNRGTVQRARKRKK